MVYQFEKFEKKTISKIKEEIERDSLESEKE